MASIVPGGVASSILAYLDMASSLEAALAGVSAVIESSFAVATSAVALFVPELSKLAFEWHSLRVPRRVSICSVAPAGGYPLRRRT